MAERDAVLFANEAFYRAFADADFSDMCRIWATGRDDISVIHPGAAPISGRERVLETWQAIFEGAAGVDIAFSDAEARIYGDVAIVMCSELVHGHGLSATNVFCRTDEGWRIVHHQAGPREIARRNTGSERPVLH